MFQKRHFEAMAGAIWAARNNQYDLPNSAEGKAYIRGMLALAFTMGTLNPRFKRGRFLTACGIYPGESDLDDELAETTGAYIA